jgi:NAD-dependent dihydropyrimidine dehydrogenase PreA subunit
VCRDLLTYSINKDACNGCTLCARICPTGAIAGNKREPHVIVHDQCIGCGSCLDVCRQHAVEVA